MPKGQLGGDFFSIGAPQSFAAADQHGHRFGRRDDRHGVAALEPTSYRLTFDGTAYTLQRADNGAVVPMTGAGTALNPFVANGISIVVSGTPAASDQFYLKPLEHVAGTVSLLVTRPADIAAAAPTRTSAALAQHGHGDDLAGADHRRRRTRACSRRPRSSSSARRPIRSTAPARSRTRRAPTSTSTARACRSPARPRPAISSSSSRTPAARATTATSSR